MENILLFVLVIVVIVIIKFYSTKPASHKKSVKERPFYNYARKDYIMTKAEHNFFTRLQTIFGQTYHVFPQVHLSSILDEKKITGQNWKAAFKHINGKSVDFVLCDKQYAKPFVALELDDSTHDRAERQNRDQEVERIFEGAKLPLVRFRAIDTFSDQEIENKIRNSLG
jgi:hypothetical protein